MYSREEKWSFSFSSFPLSKIKYQFWNCCQKALRQWIHQREAKRHLQLLVIKSYPKAAKPISLSKILHHPHKPHPPPQYSHNIQRAGGWRDGNTKQGCYCSWQSSGRWGRSPKGRGRGRALPWAALQGTLTCRSNLGAIPEPSVHEPFAEPSRGRQRWLREGWASRATYGLAGLLSALSSWLSQRIGGNSTN